MTKKILSLLLIICLAVSAVPVMAKGSAKSIEFMQAVDLLQKMDMLSDEYDRLTVDGNKTVTRAEFANIAAGVFAKDRKGDKLYFHDVPRTHWAFDAISALTDIGMIKINEEQKFYPDEDMTRSEAARSILLALGYERYLEASEANGVTVDSVAQDVKLYKGTSGKTEITFSDMIMMFYNGLLSEVLEQGFSMENASYKGSGETYLEKNYSIYSAEGLLEGYDGVSTVSQGVKDGEALISGVVYKTETDLSEYLGNNVLFFYRYDEDTDERTVFWIVGDDKDDTLTLYYCENEVTFNAQDYAIEYFDNDKGKNAKLSAACRVVYNGEFVDSGIEAVLSAPFYSIKLIGSDRVYDTAVIWSYDNCIIGGIDRDNEGFYDKNTMAFTSLKNIDRLDIFSDGGTAGTIDDLAVGDCVSIYKSKSGDRVKLVYSRNSVSGKVEKIDTYRDFRYVTIDGVEYRSAKALNAPLAKSGENVTLYLDACGHVAYVEYASGTMRYAYLIKAVYDDGEDSLILKMFDQSGAMQKVETVEKVKIDDTKYKSREAAFTALGGKSLKPQIICYEKNSDGYIKYIDTIKSGGSLYQRYAESTETYRNVGKLGRKMFLDNDTVIFGVPADPLTAPETEYFVKSKTELAGDGKYTVTSYATGTKVDFEELLVIKDGDWSQANEETGILVQEVETQLNDDDEVVECIVGYQGANRVKMPCMSGYSASGDGVGAGSFITYTTDRDGNIKQATVRYKPGMADNKRPITDNLYQGIAITTGYVNSINGTIVGIGTNSGEEFDEALNFGTGAVLVYDSSRKRVSVGSMNDLISYETARSNCSFILAHMRYSAPKVYVIYK